MWKRVKTLIIPSKDSSSKSKLRMSFFMKLALGTFFLAISSMVSEISIPMTSKPASSRYFEAGTPDPEPASSTIASSGKRSTNC